MSAREQILAKIKQNQPDLVALPSLSEITNSMPLDSELQIPNNENHKKFKEVLISIGGQVIDIQSLDEVIAYVRGTFNNHSRVITTLPQLAQIADTNWQSNDPHTLENVDLAIIEAHFGIAENGSVWITESLMGQRVALFIAQYLAVVIHQNDLVATMHEAYNRINAMSSYDFGTFVAGPSKTADIEQSLVLGAHGARGLTVFLMQN
jgi:L-lactate dehydrogenase complex protein LldG